MGLLCVSKRWQSLAASSNFITESKSGLFSIDSAIEATQSVGCSVSKLLVKCFYIKE
jgi:hypothetical protein